MGEKTSISWADHTFNPWIGCTRISPACDGCYAAFSMETRFGRAEWGGPGKGNGTRVRTSAANWKKPLAWNAKAAKDGTRPFVFCASLADVFDNAVPEEWRKDLFDLIRATPHLVWLLLTKRPQNIAIQAEKAGGLPSNAAIGTTVEDQPRANINVPALLRASVDLWKARTRPLFLFLSCEPLIGPVDLTAFKDYPESQYHTDALRGRIWMKPEHNNIPGTSHVLNDRDYVDLCHSVQWVITGGETDQGNYKARPMHHKWALSLLHQCENAGIPFHFKQWGEYVSGVTDDHFESGVWFEASSEKKHSGWVQSSDNCEWWNAKNLGFDGPMWMRKGKAAGRKLEGHVYDMRPHVPAIPFEITLSTGNVQ